jgi:hypothetical protein
MNVLIDNKTNRQVWFFGIILIKILYYFDYYLDISYIF